LENRVLALLLLLLFLKADVLCVKILGHESKIPSAKHVGCLVLVGTSLCCSKDLLQ